MESVRMKKELTARDDEEIEKKIGYAFKNKSLLKLAFTHSTYANQYGGEDNERLEYLGDSVLQLVVSEAQYHSSEKKPEGSMTEERQRFVSQGALLSVVKDLGIFDYLLCVGGQANFGGKTVSSLFETVTAAIYLDGGYDEAKSFVLKHLKEIKSENYIGKLQELQDGRLNPVYREVSKQGTDNAPLYRYSVSVNSGERAEGEGGDITSAKQSAAKTLLEKLSLKESD